MKSKNTGDINRLKNHVVYLCGAIDLCPDNGKSWREEIAPQLEALGLIVWTPLDKPLEIGLENDDSRETRKKMLAEGRYSEFSEIMKLVRHADLRMVDKCDFVLAYIDLDIYAVGTWEEIFWANRLMRPVVLVCKQGKQHVPHWVFGALKNEMFFDDFDGALSYIKHVDSSDNPETFNRWVFFKRVAQQQGI